ncbi:MAG: DEAD/DEAH box helicase [Planctomycetia bacterium]
MARDEDLRWHADSISIPPLRSTGTDALLDVHLAAIEYALATPITIRNKDDIKSQKHWSETFEPFEHQVRNLITFCRRAPVALIADDVGLGKTISAGLVLSELMTRKKVKRALIVAPKLLLPQWREELQAKFGIEARHASGTDLGMLIRSTIPVVVTTYETARSRFDDLSRAFFDMIVLDEAHKLRNLHGTNQAPLVAEAVRSSFRKADFKYVLMLTATPIQNRLWDLYSLVDLLATARGHENPLGSPKRFADYYIKDSADTARQLQDGRREEFRRRIAEYMVRTSRRDSNLVFPERKVKTLGCPAGAAETRLSELVKSALPRLNALVRSSIAQALMSSPAALVAQLQNMAANGTVPAVLPRQAAEIAAEAGPGCKMTRLRVLLRELAKERPQDWRAVVFTRRKETQDLIGRTLANEGVRVGYIRGGQAEQNQRAIKSLWSDPPEINLLVSTDAGAEGVNMQVANVVINYDLPWNPMVVEQRIGRVQRLASKHRNIIVVNLVVADSVEEVVVARLIAKLQAISETIGDIEGILETSSISEEGLEDTIADLVLKALMGQDVAAATAKIIESIKRAKEAYQEERDEVERNLGGLDAMHTAGPRMPELAEITPRLPAEEFVRQALVGSGASLTPAADGRWLVKAEGRAPFIVTFNEDDPDLAGPGFGGLFGTRAELYAEGRPPFERLVGEWARRDAALMADWTDEDGAVARALITDWARRLGSDVVVEAWHPKSRTMRAVGELTVRSSAAVAIDRYEKLVTLQVGSEDVRAALVRAGRPKKWVRGDIRLGEHVADLAAKVRSAVSDDDHVAAFCEFYEARLEEELRKSVDHREAEVIRKRFQPALAAEVVAAHGFVYDEIAGVASLRIGDGGPYQVSIAVRTGTAEVIAEPERDTCLLSGRTVPVTCLASSAVSGRSALRHLLVSSERSSRLGFPDEAVTCQASGRTLLADEVSSSDVSGLVVDRDLLQTSVISGKSGCGDEIVHCAFTGAPLLKPEGRCSQVSGKLYRPDEEAASDVSGVRGHQSEFVRCGASRAYMLPSEGDKSAVSGEVVRKDLLVPSLSGALALDEELITCAFTSVRLLPIEARQSDVSGKWYRMDEEAKSAVSGVSGHKSEFETCEQAGVLALPGELERSSVSGKRVCRSLLVRSAVSGKLALGEELLQCEFTHGRMLEAEAARSEVSGRLYRADQQASSVKSAVRGHVSEFQICEETGALALPAEMALSSVSGRRALRDLLSPSDRDPERLGLDAEVVTCAVSGKRLLVDEVVASAVSGKRADSRLIARSEKSGQPALPCELVRCEESGAMLLPVEVGQCQVTGKRVDKACLGASAYSQKSVLKRLLRVCPETQMVGLESEMGRCEVTGQFYDQRRLVECAVTGRQVCRSLTVPSAVSGRALLRDKAVTAQSGRFGHPDEALKCGWTGVTLLFDEASQCRLTGVLLGKSCLDGSGISAAHADLLGRFDAIVPDAGQGAADVRYVLQSVGIKPTRVWMRKSPLRDTWAAVAEVRTLLGLRRKHAVFFLEGRRALGQIALVDVRDGKWEAA